MGFGITERPRLGRQPPCSSQDNKWTLRVLVPDYTMEKSSVGDYSENRKVALSLPDDTQHPHTASKQDE